MKKLSNNKFTCISTSGNDGVLSFSPMNSKNITLFENKKSKSNKVIKVNIRSLISKHFSKSLVGINGNDSNRMTGMLNLLPDEFKVDFLLTNKKRTGGVVESFMCKKITDILGVSKKNKDSYTINREIDDNKVSSNNININKNTFHSPFSK